MGDYTLLTKETINEVEEDEVEDIHDDVTVDVEIDEGSDI